MNLKKNIRREYDYENGDFWYDLTDGGYLSPEDFLHDEDADAVRAAILVLHEFNNLLAARADEVRGYT